MGPISKTATVKRQLADSDFQAAVLEEFRWIRARLNKLVGEHALDQESIAERVETLENRVSGLERSERTGPA